MITLQNLSKNFGSKQVLQNIDISFAQGRVYGIVGENGAGKTTLFRCIAGLEDYTGVLACSTGVLKDQLGYLPTEPYFFPYITGQEYLHLLCQARQKSTGDLQARNIFDLPLHQYALAYSTGMKKKLALMGVLLQENQYLILDEPYNGVDIQSSLMITDIILQLKALGKTVILSSHIFATLQETCDEIFWLQKGNFARHVPRAAFETFAQEIKQATVGDKIARFGLR